MGFTIGAGYAVTPASQNTTPGVATGNFTITLDNPAPVGGQSFQLIDDRGGGTLAPGTLVTVAAAATTVTFTYSNPTAGTYPIDVTPSGGALAGQPTQTVEAVVVTGSPTPTGFNITPGNQTAQPGALTRNYFINLLAAGGGPAAAGAGGQPFALSSSDAGGQFIVGGAVVTSVTVPQNGSSVSFQYRAYVQGTDTLTATASGAPYGTNVQTAQAVIGVSKVQTPVISNPQQTWATVYATINGIPFAQMQEVTIQSAASFKPAKDATALVATGLGQDNESVTGTAKSLLLDEFMYLQMMGGTQVVVAAIADPTVAPVATAATGVSNFTSGFIGLAYSYQNQYGQTKITAVGTVSVTGATQKITTPVITPPTGVVGVNWFMTNQSYATAPLAAAAPLSFVANSPGGAAMDLLAYASPAMMSPVSVSQLTQKTSFQHTTNQQRKPFDLIALSDEAGTKRGVYYNCVAPNLDWTLGLYDWAQFNFTWDCYGKNGILFEWLQ